MLNDHVERYLALRRALGYKLLNTARNGRRTHVSPAPRATPISVPPPPCSGQRRRRHRTRARRGGCRSVGALLIRPPPMMPAVRYFHVREVRQPYPTRLCSRRTPTHDPLRLSATPPPACGSEATCVSTTCYAACWHPQHQVPPRAAWCLCMRRGVCQLCLQGGATCHRRPDHLFAEPRPLSRLALRPVRPFGEWSGSPASLLAANADRGSVDPSAPSFAASPCNAVRSAQDACRGTSSPADLASARRPSAAVSRGDARPDRPHRRRWRRTAQRSGGNDSIADGRQRDLGCRSPLLPDPSRRGVHRQLRLHFRLCGPDSPPMGGAVMAQLSPTGLRDHRGFPHSSRGDAPASRIRPAGSQESGSPMRWYEQRTRWYTRTGDQLAIPSSAAQPLVRHDHADSSTRCCPMSAPLGGRPPRQRAAPSACFIDLRGVCELVIASDLSARNSSSAQGTEATLLGCPATWRWLAVRRPEPRAGAFLNASSSA